MGQLLIRNLDEDTIASLKRSASREGLSLEQYLRDLLKAKVEADRTKWLSALDALHASIDIKPGPLSLQDMLEMDDRDKQAQAEPFRSRGAS